jgi:GT2 family glycosyltransferase
MEADHPPPESAPPLAVADPEDPGEGSQVPSVVAVVVARGEAPHLEACLAGLRDSDYPDLTVLVMVPAGSELRARVAEVLPRAFVRPVEADGFAAAADDALATVAGAPFLLFCHDDVVPDPTAVRVLVEEAYRSNAAVVGPKLVDVEHPEILREVGWSVDRFGVPHSDIVLDELDQEQHDAVRDVFFVGEPCVLVRADLFAALEGFDVACDPGAAALDFCWRARLAGARVIVAPDARVRHHDADGEVDPGLERRHQVRALLTSTSTARLLWIVPVALVVQFAEAVVYFFRRRRTVARALIGAWTHNLGHFGEVRVARRRAQEARVVSDAEIHALQFRGSARVSAYVATTLHAPDRVRALSDRGRTAADTAGARLRSIRGLVLVAMLALVAIGVRDLVFGRVSAVGTLLPWPGVGSLLRSYTSEWRYAALGADAPAPPVFVLAGLLRIVTLGAGGFARALLVVGAIPLGMFGAFRLARSVAGRGWPPVVVAVVYGAVPLPRNAIQLGHIGALVLYALAPLVVAAVFMLAGIVDHRWPRRRIAALGGVGLAIAAAWWPLAILLPLVLVVGLAIAAPASGDGVATLRRAGRAALTVTGLGLALLLPWPIAFALAGDRAAALGIVQPAVGSFGALLRFATGSSGAGIGGWAFVGVAVLVLLIAGGDEARWAARSWGIALLAWLLAALPAWLGTASPDPEGVLVPAALAVALLAGLGTASFLGEIRRLGLGWRQVGALVAAALVVLSVFGFVGDITGGRFRQPAADWPDTLSWMNLQRDRGPFRVLWVGNPATVPGYRQQAGVDGYMLSDAGSGDLRDALPPPGGAGATAANAAVHALRTRTTQRFGREVAPMAVRYIVLTQAVAPGGTPVAPSPFGPALEEQLDLRELQSQPGARVYENTAWLPGDAVVGGRVPATGPAPALGSATGRAGDTGRMRGTVLWSQQYDDAWEATSSTGTLPHRRAVGWANAFTGQGVGPVEVTYTDQWWRWPVLALEIVIAVILGRRILRRGRRRGRRAQRNAAVPAGDAETTTATTTAEVTP